MARRTLVNILDGVTLALGLTAAGLLALGMYRLPIAIEAGDCLGSAGWTFVIVQNCWNLYLVARG